MNTESREHIEETAATYIARRGSDQWTDADASELATWLAASVSHRAAYYRLNAAWQEAGRLQALNSGPSSAQASGLRPQYSSSSSLRPQASALRTFSRPRYFAVAATVLLVIAAALGSTWYLWPTGPAYRTEVGGLAAVPLTDGSKVALNTDSEIRVALDEKERHIYLKRGEAFFEVAKDPNRPFIVQVGNKRVIAVGTKFSVRYLPSAHTLIGGDGDDTRVLVAEGTVRMEGVRDPQASGLSTQHSVLTVGTIARALDDAFLVEENRSVEIERNLTWRAGQLTFRDTPLADAVAEFNRYNARKIVIEDASVAALQVGGIFRATNIDPFVRLIEQAFPIQVREEDDRIILTAAK